MSAHEMQHPDSPTWCVHCGTFDPYCKVTDCTPNRDRLFDMSDQANWRRTLVSVFGLREAWPAALQVRERP